MTIREVDAQGSVSPMVPNDPPTRSFESFAEAARECSMSRIYLGIHFRCDSEVGTELGEQVGARAIRTHLRPVTAPSQ